MDALIALWPVAILQDRYSGVYSGAEWLALGEWDTTRLREFYDGALGCDGDAMEYWETVHDVPWIGKGRTPDEALADLLRRHAGGAK